MTVAQSRGGRGVRIKPRKGGISGYMNDVHSTIAITESIARAGECSGGPCALHQVGYLAKYSAAFYLGRNDGLLGLVKTISG